MREPEDIEDKISRYGDTVWRACLVYFKPGPDAEDVFQETFFKYSLHKKPFTSDEHVKAWLITVATNKCKDLLKASGRKYVELDQLTNQQLLASQNMSVSSDESMLFEEVMTAMRKLDDPPRTPLYLAAYEGYTAPEIANMLNAPINTVYSWISRGKKQLREALS